MADPGTRSGGSAARGARAGWSWPNRKKGSVAERQRRDAGVPEPPAIDLEITLPIIQNLVGEVLLRLSPREGESSDGTPEPTGVALVAAALLQAAIEADASDLHLQPSSRSTRVRIRVDGMLQELATLPSPLHAALAGTLKAAAGIDPAESRLPQAGLIRVRVKNEHYTLHTRTLPGEPGETLVLRILGRPTTLLGGLHRLGTFPDTLVALNGFLSNPSGLLVVGGPARSGKTTTLYSALTRLNARDRHLVTVEDPVGGPLPGVTQVAVDPSAGLTSSAALRAGLLHDPDILMVDELRDRETAELAVQENGRGVMAAMRAYSAAAVPSRLVGMGAPAHLVASSLKCAVAQRLARRLCDKCKRPAEDSLELRDLLARLCPGPFDGYDPLPIDGLFHRAGGCAECRHTGFRGRVGLFEVLEVTPAIKSAILRREPAGEIEAIAVRAKMKTLAEDGFRKAAASITSLEEVARVLPLGPPAAF